MGAVKERTVQKEGNGEMLDKHETCEAVPRKRAGKDQQKRDMPMQINTPQLVFVGHLCGAARFIHRAAVE